MQKYILLTFALTVVVGLGLFIDRQSQAPVRHATDFAPTEVVFAPGRIEGATPEVELRPWIGGRVAEILVTEGDIVESGAVLLRIDDRQYRHQRALAKADLSLAVAERERLQNGARPSERREARALYEARLADLERAELAWKRIRNLRADGVVAQQEADSHRTQVALYTAQAEAAQARADLFDAPPREDELAMANARIEAARASLELAKVNLDRTMLKAPGAGRVLQIDVETGEMAGPDTPQAAVIFADTSRLRVRAFVDEIDAPRIRRGQAARITVDGLPGQPLTGRVAELRQRMSPKMLTTNSPTERFDTKTREIWIDLDLSEAQDCLLLGLVVDVQIDVNSEEDPSGRPSRKTPSSIIQ